MSDPAYSRERCEDLAVPVKERSGSVLNGSAQVEREKRLAGRALEPSAQVGLSVSSWRRLHGVLRGPESFRARSSLLKRDLGSF